MTTATDPTLKFWRQSIDALSDQQKRVLNLILTGHSRPCIAEAMGVSEGSVSSYWLRMMDRLGLDHHAQLLRVACRLDMVPDDDLPEDYADRFEQLDETHRKVVRILARGEGTKGVMLGIGVTRKSARKYRDAVMEALGVTDMLGVMLIDVRLEREGVVTD